METKTPEINSDIKTQMLKFVMSPGTLELSEALLGQMLVQSNELEILNAFKALGLKLIFKSALFGNDNSISFKFRILNENQRIVYTSVGSDEMLIDAVHNALIIAQRYTKNIEAITKEATELTPTEKSIITGMLQQQYNSWSLSDIKTKSVHMFRAIDKLGLNVKM